MSPPDLKQTVDNLNVSLEEAHVASQDVNMSLLEVQASLEETQAVLNERESALQLQKQDVLEKEDDLLLAAKKVRPCGRKTSSQQVMLSNTECPNYYELRIYPRRDLDLLRDSYPHQIQN